MKYLVVDASLNGTGIRDEYNGGYISPDSIGLSNGLIQKINHWLNLYAEEIYKGYSNLILLENLDKEGVEIALKIKTELKDVKILYFSAAKMQKYIL
ncbi:hypothetical protein FACS18947_1140 [Bacteroidia bacterium]|nr:hypothetical protein FACS18947_1140 [Bacteroidia bacterium]